MEKNYDPSKSERILSDALNNKNAYLSPNDKSLSAEIRRAEAIRTARSEVESLILDCRRAGKLTVEDFVPVYCTSSFGFGCRT